MVMMRAMAPKAPVELTVTFGPTPSPLLRRAVAVARDATTWGEITPGVWRASFTLGLDPKPYARAWVLLRLVGTWKATEVQVAGSPEPLVPVVAMAQCAREWLRRAGACRAAFPAGPWPKCELCPLYDPGWAAESYASPPFFGGGMPPPEGTVPDYPP
jgi:hypothetical protein